MRQRIIAGNWKMHTSPDEGVKLVQQIVELVSGKIGSGKKVVIIPPFTHLERIAEIIKDAQSIYSGAQNCHYEEQGAFTGEISAKMIAATKTKYVIIGHSERRQFFGETNEILSRKISAAHTAGLIPIYCCGETLEERETGRHFQIVEAQIMEGLHDFGSVSPDSIVIAYEPVWAIGTGKTASPEQAQEIHAFIRSLLDRIFGVESAQLIPILYGGSVKADNAATLFQQTDIDGGLVGGASLKAEEFSRIILAD